jgi:Arc/MetJ-type ribon-helix-helix transcriptional regulator
MQRVSVSLPQGLYQEAMQLVRAGYYVNLAEAIRASLREEVDRKRPAFYPKENAAATLRRIERIQRVIQDAGGLGSKDEVLADLRRIREEVWQERYASAS